MKPITNKQARAAVKLIKMILDIVLLLFFFANTVAACGYAKEGDIACAMVSCFAAYISYRVVEHDLHLIRQEG